MAVKGMGASTTPKGSKALGKGGVKVGEKLTGKGNGAKSTLNVKSPKYDKLKG
jgi:hypothetical protein